MKMTLTGVFCAVLLTLGASHATASPITFHVDVTTASLVGNAAGPFSLDFQLIGNAGNTATVSGFNFNGGSAVGAPTLTGDATGSLTSTVTLSDTASFFNEFFQQFTPGTSLGFNVSVTNLDPSPGDAPDAFAFSILDNALFEIPTTGLANKLLTLDITSTAAIGDVQTFASSAPTDVTVTASAVPEPGSLLLLGAGLAAFAARRGAARRRSSLV